MQLLSRLSYDLSDVSITLQHDSILNREIYMENLASFAKGGVSSSLPVQERLKPVFSPT